MNVIPANAAQLFPDIVKTHLDYHNEKIAKPAEIFAVVTELTQKPDGSDSVVAVLTHGNPMARRAAASSTGSNTVESALRQLLRGLSMALEETDRRTYGSLFTQGHYFGEDTLIAADLLPVDFPWAKLDQVVPGPVWKK